MGGGIIARKLSNGRLVAGYVVRLLSKANLESSNLMVYYGKAVSFSAKPSPRAFAIIVKKGNF